MVTRGFDCVSWQSITWVNAMLVFFANPVITQLTFIRSNLLRMDKNIHLPFLFSNLNIKVTDGYQ